MIAVILIILVALIALFTTIQTLYVETMRLRTRELPTIVYFKEVMEAKLKMRPETGSLTFSLWKHACMVAMGVFVMAQMLYEGSLNALDVTEALAVALLLMSLSAYLIPQFLYQRSSGHWMNAFLPFYSVTALAARPLAAELDTWLHAERVDRRTRKQVTRRIELGGLPDGSMVRHNRVPALVCAGALRPWSPTGYGTAMPAGPRAHVELLTPPSIVAALAAGYRPLVHPSAGPTAMRSF